MFGGIGKCHSPSSSLVPVSRYRLPEKTNYSLPRSPSCVISPPVPSNPLRHSTLRSAESPWVVGRICIEFELRKKMFAQGRRVFLLCSIVLSSSFACVF